MIVVLILIFLLILEEILHRLNRGSSFMNVDLAGDSVEQVEHVGAGRITRLLVWIRIVQLFVFGLLFAIIAALSGTRVICTSPGQLAGLTLLIQVVRILHRKVINQWAVLGVTVILQVLLLVILMISGITSEPIQATVHEASWIVSLMSFIVLFLLSVTMSFTATFYLRLLSREGSGFYYFLPSLTYSEYWIERLTRISAVSALLSLIMVVFLIINNGYPVGTSILQLVLVLFLFTAMFLSRSRLKLFHPSSVFLVAAAWFVNIVWLLADLASKSSNWIA